MFDEAFAPKVGIQRSATKDKPDIVFLAHNPDAAKAKKGDGEVVDSYEAGIEMANGTARTGSVKFLRVTYGHTPQDDYTQNRNKLRLSKGEPNASLDTSKRVV
jgi:hypothetical protein